MTPEQWKTIKELFSTVVELPPADRSDYLANSSADIRREVEKLLASYNDAEHFIDRPFVVEKGLRKNGRAEDLIGKTICDYLILEKLGEGGMGVVYLAEQRGVAFWQTVALKIIKRGMDTNAVLKRFLMERQILAQLEHPYIARLIDGGSTEDGLPYFVMEFVEGEPIRKYCETHELDTNARLELFVKVCQAISYAHQNLVVHRDIKPTNIIVTADGTPKLLDFGIAKVLTPDWNESSTAATMTQFRLMTPEYASPEQLRGRLTTTATDIYSLGVVLYELLTGTRPFKFESNDPLEISEEILTKEPIRPSECGMWNAERGVKGDPITAHDKQNLDTGGSKRSRIPQSALRNLKGDLDNIILKSIRREPERRYNSVDEFCEDINRYLAGLPVRATADTVGYRLGKFVKRHRTGVLASAAIAVLLVASTVVTSWEYFAAKREKAKAEQRFGELRDVAKSLLTETNVALKNLQEGAEVRKAIVEKSVAMLDSLAGEEQPDAAFLSELADAYDELGKIRHFKFHESRAALGDYEKALRLREKAAEFEPQNYDIGIKRSTTLGNMAEIYVVLGDTPKLLESWEMQRENNLRLLDLDPENPMTLYGLSVQTEEISHYLKNFGRTSESEEQMTESFDYADKAIAAQQARPFVLKEQVDLVSFMMQKGSLLAQSKRYDEALTVYKDAAEIAEETYRADSSLQFAFNHTSRIHRHIADIYRERGDWPQFLENTEFSINWINSETGPPHLRGKPMFYIIRKGVALDKLGKKREGSALVDEGVREFVGALKRSAADGENIFYSPEVLEMVTDFYTETNQIAKCVRLWQIFIDQIGPFVTRNPNDTTSLGYLSYAFERKGDVFARYEKEGDAFGAKDRSSLLKAVANYRQSLEYRQKVVQADTANQTQTDQVRKLSVKIDRLTPLVH